MIGSDAERGGILGGYERVVARLARATVPKVAVVVRKAYGGGHFALGGRPDPPRPRARLADGRAGLHGAGHRRPHRPPAPAGGRCADGGRGGPRRARRGARGRVGARVRALGGRGAHLPRRRHRPAPDARGRSRPGIDFAWGSGPRLGSSAIKEDPCQDGPLAHICLLVRDLDQAVADWRRSSPSSTPPSSRSRSCRRPLGGGRRRHVLGDLRQPGRLRDPAPLPAQRRPARPPAREARRGRPSRLLHLARPAGRGRPAGGAGRPA